MDTRYWVRIAVTMLIIFVVGAVVWSGINRGKQFVADNFPSYLSLMSHGFRIDGDKVGDIRRVQFMRSSPGRIDSAVITVKVNDSAAVPAGDCLLTARHAAPLGNSTHFTCTDRSDSSDLALVRFGHVVLQPAGTEIPLYVAAASLDAARAGAVRGVGTGDSGDVDINTGNGRLSVVVNGREIVSANDDSRGGRGGGGGSLVIRAANGQPIVEISGDSAHGSLRIMDANGKTRLNIGNSADTSH